MSSNRELGVIDFVKDGPEDHGIDTVWIGIKFGEGGFQSFGGLALHDGLVKKFLNDVCWTFGVDTKEELVGKNCAALYYFAGYGELIDGLESIDTRRRFLISNFQRSVGLKVPDPLTKRKERIQEDIDRHKSDIERLHERLRSVSNGYKNWEEVK